MIGIEMLGGIHWFIAIAIGIAFLWRERQGNTVSHKPFHAAVFFFLLGMFLSLTEHKWYPLLPFDIAVFRIVDFGSVVIAIAYGFLLYGAVRGYVIDSEATPEINTDAQTTVQQERSQRSDERQ